MKIINVVKLAPEVQLPEYGSPQAACFDIRAYIPGGERKIVIPPGSNRILDTGLKVQLPQDHVLLLFSRSGHGFKNNIRLANCVGVIDEDYTGEIKAKLTNDSFLDTFIVNDGDRVVQGLVLPIERVGFNVVEELKATTRGEGGLGSTGVR